MDAALDAEVRWPAFLGPAWAEVDLDAIAENVRWIRGRLHAGCRLMAVVKADAYGHGAMEVARTVLAAGADALAVSTVSEALALREDGVLAPMLVLTPVRPPEAEAALELDLAVTVADLDGAQDLARVAARRGRAAVAHVKCDSGMGRYGLLPEELVAAAPSLRALEGAIRWEGVFTHFARGADVTASRRQLRRFLAALEGCAAAGLAFPLRHAAASAGFLALPESQLDMVRVGSLLYGSVPAGLTAPGLRRAFALRARVAQVRWLPRGARVGYGGEWVAPRASRLATLPVGFADGFGLTPAGPYRRVGVLLRALARALLGAVGLGRLAGPAQGEVWLAGRALPVRGRVGMQQVTVDCGDLAVRAGDVATLHLPATLAGPRLARVYLRDGVPVGARAGVAAATAPTRVPGR
jgi:alanine racemase